VTAPFSCCEGAGFVVCLPRRSQVVSRLANGGRPHPKTRTRTMIDTQVLTTALHRLLDRHGQFEGTATHLLELFGYELPINHANHLTALLRKHRDLIEQSGISITFTRSRDRNRRRLIRISRSSGPPPSPEPARSAPVTMTAPSQRDAHTPVRSHPEGHARVAALPVYGSTPAPSNGGHAHG
jgi:hypothetical protein